MPAARCEERAFYLQDSVLMGSSVVAREPVHVVKYLALRKLLKKAPRRRGERRKGQSLSKEAC